MTPHPVEIGQIPGSVEETASPSATMRDPSATAPDETLAGRQRGHSSRRPGTYGPSDCRWGSAQCGFRPRIDSREPRKPRLRRVPGSVDGRVADPATVVRTVAVTRAIHALFSRSTLGTPCPERRRSLSVPTTNVNSPRYPMPNGRYLGTLGHSPRNDSQI